MIKNNCCISFSFSESCIEEGAEGFTFLDKDPDCGEDAGYLTPGVEEDPVNILHRGTDDWQVSVDHTKSRVTGTKLKRSEVTGWFLLSSHQKEVAKRSAMMTLNRDNSRFTSYVDLNSTDDPGDLELEIKPSLLGGEMMITQADKVCLYSSQFGG